MPIKNFESETASLSDYDKETLIPLIIRGLKFHEGPKSAITSAQICSILRSKGYKISDVTLRKCIKHIQRNDLLNWVVATGNGFFYTQDRSIVLDQIESLKGRETAIRSVRVALEESLQKMLH